MGEEQRRRMGRGCSLISLFPLALNLHMPHEQNTALQLRTPVLGGRHLLLQDTTRALKGLGYNSTAPYKMARYPIPTSTRTACTF